MKDLQARANRPAGVNDMVMPSSRIVRTRRLLTSLLRLPVLLLLILFPVLASQAQEDPDFAPWLQELRQEAESLGYSEETINLAFSEITPPVQRIIDNDRSQPEVVQTYADYLDARVSDWKIENGRRLMREHADLLAEIAGEYGVQPRFIVAIWGMETNFGTFPIRESIFNVLATLAYDNRRGEFFRAQFLAALGILDSGFPGYESMKSSWAGAMGQSQFIPQSYLEYAVDFDGDGNRDIWNSTADVLASIANYLAARGWRDDQTWGRPVRLPAGGEERLDLGQSEGATPPTGCRGYGRLGAWRDLQDWQSLGVRRANGDDLPTRSLPAALVMADAGDDRAYVVYRNFCGIMGYNPATKYALSIGLLADRLQSGD